MESRRLGIIIETMSEKMKKPDCSEQREQKQNLF